MVPSPPDRRGGILAVFAHPDDETFLAGGTLARYAAAGVPVRVLCATRGEAGKRCVFERLTGRAFGCLRVLELRAACESLGIEPPIVLGCPDGGVAGACEKNVACEVEAALERFAPEVVITFGADGMSGHPDHVAVHRAVAAAVRRQGERPRRTGLPELYFVAGSRSLPDECRCTDRPLPAATAEVDIASVGERKLAAIRRYRSQAHLHPRNDAEALMVTSSPERFTAARAAARRPTTDLFAARPSARSRKRPAPPRRGQTLNRRSAT